MWISPFWIVVLVTVGVTGYGLALTMYAIWQGDSYAWQRRFLRQGEQVDDFIKEVSEAQTIADVVNNYPIVELAEDWQDYYPGITGEFPFEIVGQRGTPEEDQAWHDYCFGDYDDTTPPDTLYKPPLK